MAATYLVEFPGPEGERDVVRVWASDESDAIAKAEDWIRRTQTIDPREGYNSPFGGRARARLHSSDAVVDAVGVATGDHDVGYRFIASNGSWLPIRTDPVAFDAATATFRTAPRWEESRRSLFDLEVDPQRAVILSLTEDDRGAEPIPFAAIVMAPDGHVLQWRSERVLSALPREAIGNLLPGWEAVDVGEDRWLRWLARAGRQRLELEGP
jgi:hypothetical protein